MHYTRGEQILGNQFFMVAPIICGSSVWNLLHVTQLGPTILRWLIDFFNLCTSALNHVCCVAHFSFTYQTAHTM